jgi:pyruvate carboxylase
LIKNEIETKSVLQNQQHEANGNELSSLLTRQEAVQGSVNAQEAIVDCLSGSRSEPQLREIGKELEDLKRSLSVARLELELSESAKQLALDDLSSTR